MKLLVSCFAFQPEAHGMSTIATNLASRLAKRGHDVHVATRPCPERVGTEAPPGVTIHEFDLVGKGHWASPVRGPIAEYRSLLADSGFDAVLLEGWENAFSELAFGGRGPKLVLCSHGTSSRLMYPGLKGVVRRAVWTKFEWSLRRELEALDHVVFLTPSTEPIRHLDARKAAAMGLRKTSVIPNGTDLAELDAAATDFRERYAGGDGSLVLCVSNYAWVKGQQRLARLFAEGGIRNATLVFIGSKRNSYAENAERQWAGKTASGSRMIFFEGLSKATIQSAYRSADLFVSTSVPHTEVQPLMIIDAMGCRLPYVTTRFGCVDELPGGISCETDGQILDGIRRLLDDGAERKRLGTEGRSACERIYNWDANVEAYDALLCRLCGN